MKIKVKATTMVKPITGKPSTNLRISNLDATTPDYHHTLTRYFYRSTAAADFFDPTVLKAALSRVLVDFYPVAGRLMKNDKDRIEINCNGEGVLFVEAESDGTVDDLGDLAPRPELSLIPPVDYSQGISKFRFCCCRLNCNCSTQQVTRFKCGGVCLGIAIGHHVSDGISSIHFINTWSDISRGLDISIPPFLDRRVLSARNPPQPQFTHDEYQPPPPLKASHDHNSNNISETIFSIFKLTRDQLNALKANCQENEGNRASYSTYEAVAGQAWRCVCRARVLQEDQETKLNILVDGRYRLRPSLPPGYFGNVVFTATPIALCGELESNPVKFAVRKIHEALARMDDEYLRSALDYLELQPNPNAHVRADPFKCPNLGIISWARLSFYDADFGWGRPFYIGVGVAPCEGQTFVLPSPTNDGSLLYALSLPKEQMQVFEKLFYDF